jgi:4-alpha-glucanotransferase
MSRDHAAALHRLAARVGILPEYLDQTGTEVRRTSDDTRVAFLRAMGFEATSASGIRHALEALDAREQSQIVPPVRVCVRERWEPAGAYLRLPDAAGGTASWQATLRLETGERRALEGTVELDAAGAGRIPLGRRLPDGYHTLEVRATARGLERDGEQSLIVAPRRCRAVPPMFGVIANLYTVRTREDWGVGDLSGLAALLEWTAAEGGDFVGVNPLHAIRNRGWDVSPYSPVSRLFRNPIYLDPAAVPAPGSVARALLDAPEIGRERAALRESGEVEYERVTALKRRVLESLHGAVEGGEAYRRYLKAEGEPLDRFATFEALVDHMGKDDWRGWPEPYRDPRSAAVAAFRRAHAREVDFHRWLQYELDRQLAGAAEQGRRAGLGVGVYQDLAIGTAASGADVWANPHLFLAGVSIGAPPDDLAAMGQNWGLPPCDPRMLHDDRYDFWIRLLRASFRHAGALRIDHVLGLFRQFWIPDGASGTDGAYVRFPADDLLGILVLEARRHGAVVVGEDLGTVPPEVRPALRGRRILSSRVFYFERDGNRFRAAAEYEPASLATANTHDLPPIAGFWSGRDIDLRRTAGAIDSDEAAEWERGARAATRAAMLERLAADGVLPAAAEPATGAELRGAVHAFLCGTPATMVGLSLDDLVGETDPVNLPGITPDRHSSWTRRLAVPVEDLAASPDVRATLRCGRRARRSAPLSP